MRMCIELSFPISKTIIFHFKHKPQEAFFSNFLIYALNKKNYLFMEKDKIQDIT